MAIDATVKGPAANSYVTLTEANTYFAARLKAEAWTANAGKQENALRMATKRLDQEQYLGTQTTTTQALRWPRRYVANPDTGEDYDENAIPQALKDAQCEIALDYLNKDADPFAPSDLTNFESVAVGPIDVTLVQPVGSADEMPNAVLRMLANLLGGGGGQTFRIVRA